MHRRGSRSARLPFLDAEDRIRMRQTLRKYEDDLDAVERRSFARWRRLCEERRWSTSEKFQEILNDKKNTTFTEAERKAYSDLQERSRRMTAESLRLPAGCVQRQRSRSACSARDRTDVCSFRRRTRGKGRQG